MVARNVTRLGLLTTLMIGCWLVLPSPSLAVDGRVVGAMRYRLKEGQRFSLVVKREALTTVPFNNEPVDIKQTLRLTAVFEVLESHSRDFSVLAVRFPRFFYTVEFSASGDRLRYDASKRGKSNLKPALKAVLDVLTEAGLDVKVGRRGDVRGIDLSPELNKALLDYRPSVLEMGGVFSPSGLQQLLQEWFAVFPDGRVLKKKDWKHSSSAAFGPGRFCGTRTSTGTNAAKQSTARRSCAFPCGRAPTSPKRAPPARRFSPPTVKAPSCSSPRMGAWSDWSVT